VAQLSWSKKKKLRNKKVYQKSYALLIIFLAMLFCRMDSMMEPSAAFGDEYSPETLFLTLYADGMVDVEYVVSVDTLLVDVNISIPGAFYENLVVTNERDLPLDYSISDGKVLVSTLGSWKLKFFYTAPDLTSKVGRLWTLHVNSSIKFTVRLPADATVVSLSAVPTSIWIADGHYFLTMPLGDQEISYIIGMIGSRERALALINEADHAIEDAKDKGADVTQAESKLEEAMTALEEGRYSEAELLATEAKQIAEEAPPKLTTQPLDLYWIIGVVVAVGLAVAFISFQLRRRALPRAEKKEKTFRQINVHRILEGREYLRLEDREAIEFIASAGGEVFEAELRERFRLPKSTTWRMVKRLKREGLVEVEKVGGQNLIRLIEK